MLYELQEHNVTGINLTIFKFDLYVFILFISIIYGAILCILHVLYNGKWTAKRVIIVILKIYLDFKFSYL